MNKLLYLITLIIVAALFYWLGSLNVSNNSSIETSSYKGEQPSLELNNESRVQRASNFSSPNTISSEEVISDETLEPAFNKRSYEDLAKELASLTKQSQEQSAKFRGLSVKYDAARMRLLEAGLEELTLISKAEASKILPPPFDHVIASSDPFIMDKFKAFHEEEQDYDWALQMESQISDFFVLHEHRDLVQLVKVNCKKSQCELYGYHEGDLTIGEIMDDLNAQEWFHAIQTNSMYGDIAPNIKGNVIRPYFYTIIIVSR